MNNVLVLGGTGAMGSFLVQILAQKGYSVYVTTRSSRKSFDNICYYQGNAHNISFLKCILSDKSWFAVVDFMQYTTNEFQDRYQLFLKSTLQYIFVSSARVYADSTQPIKETSPRLLDTSKDKDFLGTDDYALAKARQEDILLKNNLKNWTIIRPYMTYFDNRLDLGYFSKELWLFRVINNKSILFMEDVASKLTTLTYGFDVANSIYCLLGEKNALGEIFNITQYKICKWSEILKIYKKCIEDCGYILKVRMFEKSPIVYDYIYKYDRAFNRVFDSSKISIYIDTNSFVDPLDGLANCMNNFLKKPSFLSIDWKKQAFWDQILNERTSLSEIGNKKKWLIYLLFRYVLPCNLVYKMRHHCRILVTHLKMK